jgi:hypothetical protein
MYFVFSTVLAGEFCVITSVSAQVHKVLEWAQQNKKDWKGIPNPFEHHSAPNIMNVIYEQRKCGITKMNNNPTRTTIKS